MNHVVNTPRNFQEEIKKYNDSHSAAEKASHLLELSEKNMEAAVALLQELHDRSERAFQAYLLVFRSQAGIRSPEMTDVYTSAFFSIAREKGMWGKLLELLELMAALHRKSEPAPP